MTSHFFIVFIIFLSGVAMAADPATEQRLQRIERLLDNQNLLEMFTLLQRMQEETSKLRGDVELLNHEISEIKSHQKDIYLDLDQRLQALDAEIKKAKAAPPVLSFDAAVSPGGATEATSESDGQQISLQDQESYQSALTQLKQGKYDDAIQSFQVFLISYPESSLAANAQYWMAEAYYVLKNYDSAIAQFSKVVTAYPNSNKVSDAHLKLGFSFYEKQDWTNAVKALEKVISDFPGSTAARLADRRIQKMKLEGHIQ